MVENLVIGKGFLGEKLVAQMRERNLDVEATTRSGSPGSLKLDITNEGQVEKTFKKLGPKNVFLLASEGNVDACEKNPVNAMAVNYEAVKTVTSFARKGNSKLFFPSTDYVFSGDKGNYRESDRKSPINVYGLTKDLAEREIEKIPNSVIVRSSSFYGFNPGRERKGFPIHVIEAIRNGKEFAAIHQKTSPILIDDIAKALIFLSEKDFSGTIHVAGPEALTRYDSARLTAKEFGLDTSLIKECEDQSELGLPAKRPKDCSLNVEKADSLGIKARDFKKGLKEMKKQMKRTD